MCWPNNNKQTAAKSFGYDQTKDLVPAGEDKKSAVSHISLAISALARLPFSTTLAFNAGLLSR